MEKRGVFDLHGLKGYNQMAAIYSGLAGASIAAALLVPGLAVASTVSGLLLSVLACCLTLLTATFSRAIAADLQRLDTVLWISHDKLLVKWGPRLGLGTGALTTILVLAGVANERPWLLGVSLLPLAYLALCSLGGIAHASIARRRASRQLQKWLGTAHAPDVRRIKEGLANFTAGRQRNPFVVVRGPGLYSLAQKPFYDIADLPFLEILEENAGVIRGELEQILRGGASGFSDYPYGSIGGAGWQTFHFHNGTQRVIANTDRCPETTKIIESIPGYFTRHSVFSLLASGASAAPHRDFSNFTVNCHLGVIVPDGECEIRVGDEIRRWQQDKCLIFDTSYEHEVWNRTGHDRVVLQITTFRPELTAAEQQWFAAQLYGIDVSVAATSSACVAS